MNKIGSRCFVCIVNGVRYVVKFGKIDEFVCLFLPNDVVITSMISEPVRWEHGFQWYKRV